MSFDILDWNCEPNQRFYVKLSDIGAQMRVELFNTQADAQAPANRVAFATVDFGASVPVTLTLDSTLPIYGDPLVRYNTALSYHLKIGGIDGDTTRIYSIGPFTDLPYIEDPLMTTEEIIEARATYEINKGTHSSLVRNIALDKHYPTLQEGDVVTYSSTKRGISNIKNQILSIELFAEIGQNKEIQFFDSVEAVEYKDFVRGG